MKHEDGNICCEGCYRIGLTTGRKLTIKEVEKVLEDVRSECKDTMTFSHLDFVIDVIKKKLKWKL